MYKAVKKTEIWAITLEQAERFFQTQADVAASSEGFLYRSCRIGLKRLEDRPLGSLFLPQTELLLEGSPEDTELIYRRFCLNFLSAGG